jgi:hypothetical protein
MYCKSCGKELLGVGVFCQNCGARQDSAPTAQPTHKAPRSQFYTHAGYAPAVAVGAPAGLFSKIKALPLLIKLISVLVATALVITVTVTVATNAGHDLSGTYSTSSFFPIDRITFSTDGTFTAYSDIETLQGKYSKHGNTYSIRFTGGKSNGGNAAGNFLADNNDALYELEAEKIGDNHLRFQVIPKISYHAWFGKTVEFYKY